jgi:hypothetical protein
LLDDIVEIIEESPTYVIGIVIMLIFLGVGGTFTWNWMLSVSNPQPQIVYVNVTVTPEASLIPTIAPSIVATPDPGIEYQYMTDDKQAPGVTFKRTATDSPGVYYSDAYGGCIYLVYEAWKDGGGKITGGTPEGYTIISRWGMLTSAKYNKEENKVIAFNTGIFDQYLELERRGWYK